MLARNLTLWLTVLLALLLLSPMLLPAANARPLGEPPPVPKGIEVLARGPVHEAYASLSGEAAPTQPVPKKPPKPLDELPPADKPEGDVVWIGGYWAWDDERKDFLWVSGIWRTPPPRKQWVAGYWREEGEQWQWVPGFWTDAAPEREEAKQVTYLPKPPETPEVASPGQPPAADAFYVPGSWIWNAATGTYAWRAGYWARVQPGYVWMPDHYNWTPSGYVFIPGYWDVPLGQRGILYAPVVVDPLVMTTGFSYTPAYAVSDTVVVDALFVRPAYAHYYFGDYYGPAYVSMGYENAFLYSGRRYDSIVVYETWAHRGQPYWGSLQIDVYNGRSRGVLPVPPRTLVQQNNIIQQNITNVTNVNNNVTNIIASSNTTNGARITNYNAPVLAPAATLAASKGVKTVPLDMATRVQAKIQAASVQQVAQQRTATEQPLPTGAPRQARVASLSVPKAQAVQPGFTSPKVTPQALTAVSSPRPPQPTITPRQGFVTPARFTAPRALSAARPAAPGTPPHAGMVPPPNRPGTPGMTVSQPGRPGVQPLSGSRSSLGPSRPNPSLPHAQSAQPTRAATGFLPRIPVHPSPPPARRPPPKDPKEQPSASAR